MLSYMPTITSTDNKGSLKLAATRANSPTDLFQKTNDLEIRVQQGAYRKVLISDVD